MATRWFFTCLEFTSAGKSQETDVNTKKLVNKIIQKVHICILRTKKLLEKQFAWYRGKIKKNIVCILLYCGWELFYIILFTINYKDKSKGIVYLITLKNSQEKFSIGESSISSFMYDNNYSSLKIDLTVIVKRCKGIFIGMSLLPRRIRVSQYFVQRMKITNEPNEI